MYGMFRFNFELKACNLSILDIDLFFISSFRLFSDWDFFLIFFLVEKILNKMYACNTAKKTYVYIRRLR